MAGFDGADGTTPLTLTPDANSLAAEFAALDYSAPERNRYAYRLEGYDKDWIETEWTRRLAAYTNLPPGDYVLRLRGSNRDGVWSETRLALPIRMLPAWYQTFWFECLELLAAIGLVIGLVQARTVVLRRRQRELGQLVAERTAELVESQRQLEAIAYLDVLTSLPNRRMFGEELRKLMAQAKRRGASFALLLIDLDRFKEINDEHGHDAGDALLIEAARRFGAAVRDADSVARLGGDEFAIMLAESHAHADIEKVCRRIVDSFAEPVTFKDRAMWTSPSIGVAVYPEHGETQEALFKAADLALYAAKRAGRNTWCWFEPEMAG